MVFRPFNIYGIDQHADFLIPSIISQCKSGFVHLKDPRPKRDFIYIDDVVEACVATLNYETTKFEIFNLGSGKSHSIQEIIDTVKCITQEKIEVNYSNEFRENEILDTICDSSKANHLLNWLPKISLEQGLKMILKQEKNH